MAMHHVSIRTANIHRAIAFYKTLGLEVEVRFTTGSTLACWLTGLNSRLELIEIPEPHPAADAFGDEHYVGYYHLSIDLTDLTPDLPQWLATLESHFDAVAVCNPEVRPLKILLSPTQQQIGDRIFEVAFIADADGLPLEFLREMSRAS
jgi:catechol 2,3-dioxygenase-like lactoylglutathione lyase family enzyme